MFILVIKRSGYAIGGFQDLHGGHFDFYNFLIKSQYIYYVYLATNISK